ncbi:MULTISPECIES: phage tail assembly chaperone [unclassified Pseudomonas]|nr:MULTISPECIES: phage tail assembly chaperone [unclassified Pseudomonas]
MSANPTLSVEQFQELLTYIQALRDWPQSKAFPDTDHRPNPPPWLAEQTR